MKQKSKELDVDFIGGGRPLTKEDQEAISAFIKADKLKRAKKKSAKRRLARVKKKSTVAKVK